MAIVFSCKCGRPLRASPEAAGKKTRCPGCNLLLVIPAESGRLAATAATAGAVPTIAKGGAAPVAPVVEPDPFTPELDWSTIEVPLLSPDHDPPHSSSGIIKIDTAVADVPVVEIPRTEDGSLQYRVLTQKDQGFSGKFNPTKLEEALNAHARQGWCLKAAVTMNIQAHGTHHDELIVILER